MKWGSILLGALGLAVLDAVVSSSSGASNVGGFVAGLGTAVNWFISPTVPAFKPTSSGSANTTANETIETPAQAQDAGNSVPALSALGTYAGGTLELT